MNEKIKKAKESLEKLIEDVAIDSGCAYPALYADIRTALNDFDRYYESQQDLIKSKDEYIAKLCNDRAELKEQLKQVEDFKYHYDRYKKELVNNLKVINCMQEEATTNYNLIEQLEDRNDRLVERLEKQKTELKDLREFTKEIAKLPRFLEINHINDNNYKIRNSKYNENERCWLYQDVRCSTDDKNGWFLNERDGAMLFSKERAEELIERFKNWGFEGAEDLIIVLEYKQIHDRYVLFKKVVEKYGK